MNEVLAVCYGKDGTGTAPKLSCKATTGLTLVDDNSQKAHKLLQHMLDEYTREANSLPITLQYENTVSFGTKNLCLKAVRVINIAMDSYKDGTFKECEMTTMTSTPTTTPTSTSQTTTLTTTTTGTTTQTTTLTTTRTTSKSTSHTSSQTSTQTTTQTSSRTTSQTTSPTTSRTTTHTTSRTTTKTTTPTSTAEYPRWQCTQYGNFAISDDTACSGQAALLNTLLAQCYSGKAADAPQVKCTTVAGLDVLADFATDFAAGKLLDAMIVEYSRGEVQPQLKASIGNVIAIGNKDATCETAVKKVNNALYSFMDSGTFANCEMTTLTTTVTSTLTTSPTTTITSTPTSSSYQHPNDQPHDHADNDPHILAHHLTNHNRHHHSLHNPDHKPDINTHDKPDHVKNNEPNYQPNHNSDYQPHHNKDNEPHHHALYDKEHHADYDPHDKSDD